MNLSPAMVEAYWAELEKIATMQAAVSAGKQLLSRGGEAASRVLQAFKRTKPVQPPPAKKVIHQMPKLKSPTQWSAKPVGGRTEWPSTSIGQAQEFNEWLAGVGKGTTKSASVTQYSLDALFDELEKIAIAGRLMAGLKSMGAAAGKLLPRGGRAAQQTRPAGAGAEQLLARMRARAAANPPVKQGPSPEQRAKVQGIFKDLRAKQSPAGEGPTARFVEGYYKKGKEKTLEGLSRQMHGPAAEQFFGRRAVSQSAPTEAVSRESWVRRFKGVSAQDVPTQAHMKSASVVSLLFNSEDGEADDGPLYMEGGAPVKKPRVRRPRTGDSVASREYPEESRVHHWLEAPSQQTDGFLKHSAAIMPGRISLTKLKNIKPKKAPAPGVLTGKAPGAGSVSTPTASNVGQLQSGKVTQVQTT